jgi:hypothetical protein
LRLVTRSALRWGVRGFVHPIDWKEGFPFLLLCRSVRAMSWYASVLDPRRTREGTSGRLRLGFSEGMVCAMPEPAAA